MCQRLIFILWLHLVQWNSRGSRSHAAIFVVMVFQNYYKAKRVYQSMFDTVIECVLLALRIV